MTHSTTKIRPTPPVIKWLLNERAMLAGEVERRQERINLIQAEIEPYSRKIAALDSTIAFTESSVNPSALGSVRVHSQKYGGRGGLTQFIQTEVFSAGDTGIDTVKLTLIAAHRFEFQVSTNADLKRHCKNIRRMLLELQSRGVIDCVHGSRGGGKPSVWRTRTEHGLFEALLQQRGAIEGK